MGRFVIIDRIGRGGMGEVYSAHDPELNRKVALKILHRRVSSTRTDLLREAQAMASLSHPHIVTVHEVMITDDDCYIAMELVEGGTLKTWITESALGWREILDMLIAAGRGLAAAHAAGVVHRDFKPENVLIGKDGRPRVSDFGLARLPGEVDREDMLAGTPAYMAPEQYAGKPTDARTDQWSFCVAAYEALYGKRPLELPEGSDLPTVAAWGVEVQAGRIAPPPSGKVPARVWRALSRGLQVDPAARHPSMEALLDALAPPARRGLLYVASGLAAGLAVAAVVGLGRPVVRVCTGVDRQVAGAWNAARGRELRAAFAATGRPAAAAAADETIRALDRYAGELGAMRVEACEATRVRGEQSEAALDLRVACLDRRQRELGSLARVLASPDPEIVHGATRAARELVPVARCADLEALGRPALPPAAPLARARIDAVRTLLAGSDALLRAGKPRAALPLAADAAGQAHGLGWPPLAAEALLGLGVAQQGTGDFAAAEGTLEQAIWAGLAGHDDDTAAAAVTRMAQTSGVMLGHYDDGRRWGRMARAIIDRLGGDEELGARLEAALGEIDHQQGRFAEALAHHRAALAVRERLHGPEDLSVAESAIAAGNAAYGLGRLDDAEQSYRRALAIWRKVLGDDHPTVAVAWTSLGRVAGTRGQTREARDDFARALAVRERALGPDHPLVGTSLGNMGAISSSLGQPEQALAYLRRALPILEKAHGPEHFITTGAHVNMASTLIDLGRLDEARALLELALAARAKNGETPQLLTPLLLLGSVARRQGKLDEAAGHVKRGIAIAGKASPTHRELAPFQVELAEIELARREPRKALAAAEQAIAVAGETYGAESARVAVGLEVATRAELALGRPAAAIARLERALPMVEKADERPDIEMALARALWDGGGDRTRALALARRAREAFAAAGELRKRDLAAATAWLEGRRL